MAANGHIAKLTDSLLRVFAAARTKHEGHGKARPMLEEICKQPVFLTEALRSHISAPGALDKLHYPVLSIDLGLNPYFGLVVNVWVALPDGNTGLSTKAIHHHGDMLLSTATLFGPGYEHWTFSTPELVDERTGTHKMKLLGHPIHRHGDVAFVDRHIPHCPFYPAALSVTLALWTSRHPSTWKDRIKRLPPFKGREKFFRDVAVKLGMTQALELKVVRDFDFYPTSQGFRSIYERVEFKLGPNEDYLQSFFHTVQGTGNDTLVPELQQVLDRGWVKDTATFSRLLADLKSGRAIPGKLSEFHTNVYGFNFTREDVEAALAASSNN